MLFLEFRTKVAIGLLLAFFLFIAVGLISYSSVVANDNDRRWVIHTHTALEKLSDLLDSAVQMEAEHRAFLWTGDPECLIGFRADQNRLRDRFNAVRAFTADNPVQQHLLNRLQTALQELTRDMDQRIALRKQDGELVAVNALRQGGAWRDLDATRSLISTMQAEEQGLLRARAAQVERSSRQTKVRLTVGNLLAFILIVSTGLLVRSEMKSRKVAETKLTVVNQELGAFTYSAAHDLRAPLRHLHGFATYLQQSWYEKLDDDGRCLLDKILKSSQQMGQLLDDLLNFSRLGQTELAHSRVNLNAVFDRVVQELQPETQGRSLKWEIEDLPDVKGDPSLIQQVVFNLISNAIKYTRKQDRARIVVGTRPNGEARLATVFVRDNGAGFEMQYANKLFGVFQRLHREQEFEGTGIGLAIVRRVVERHGGEVWAEAEPGKGATFYFSLPKWRQVGGQARVHSVGG